MSSSALAAAHAAPEARRAASPGRRTVPGSQCAPWITQGTMCSRRQKTARRSPAGSAARKPSSSRTSHPAPAARLPDHRGGERIPAVTRRGTAAGRRGRPSVIVARHARAAQDRRPRGRRDGPGAARAGDPRARSRRARPRARARALRPLARAPPRDAQRRGPRGGARDARGGFGIKAATITPEGKDDVGSPNRILREEVDGKVIIRTGRRIPGVTPVARRPPPDLDRAHGGRGRLRRRAVARGRRGRAPTRSRSARSGSRASTCRAVAEYAFRTAGKMGGKVYGGPKWTVSPVYEGMLKEELDARGRAPPRGPLPAGAHRRDVRGADQRRRRQPARDPRPQPRRRLPQRPRHADVRLDRGRRVGPAGLRRRLQHPRRHGRGAARDRAGAPGQGHRQPDGDAPGLRGGAALRRRRKGHPAAERASRAIYEAVLEATAAGVRTPGPRRRTPRRAASRPRSSSGCARRSTSGRRSARRV